MRTAWACPSYHLGSGPGRTSRSTTTRPRIWAATKWATRRRVRPSSILRFPVAAGAPGRGPQVPAAVAVVRIPQGRRDDRAPYYAPTRPFSETPHGRHGYSSSRPTRPREKFFIGWALDWLIVIGSRARRRLVDAGARPLTRSTDIARCCRGRLRATTRDRPGARVLPIPGGHRVLGMGQRVARVRDPGLCRRGGGHRARGQAGL